MKKSIVFIIHFGFWSAYFLLLFLMAAAITQGFTTGPNFNYLIKLGISFLVIPSLISFYTTYSVIFPKYIQTKKIGLSFLYGTLISLGAALVGAIGISLTFGAKMMFQDNFTSFFQELISMTLISIVVSCMSIIIKGFMTWFEEIQIKEALQLKTLSTELDLIKSQLDPHFLFNTINNIDTLLLNSPELASQYLNKLSDILRFMLFETKTDKIPLSKEIAYIEKYIELQKIRTSNSNFVNLAIKGDISNHTIPAMLFIPFIENAFKHVSNKKTDNAINITLEIKQNQIIFDCQNQYSNIQKTPIENNGIGNDLIKKRIALLYPKKHNLAISNQNNTYKVNLVLSND